MKYYLLLLACLLGGLGFSQDNDFISNKDNEASPDAIPAISAFYAMDAPGGHMAELYGLNHRVGAAFSYKLKNNILFEIEAGYIFNANRAGAFSLKEKAYSVLDGLQDAKGNVISKYGTPSSVALGEQGVRAMLKVGKILPFWQTNVNSGPVIMGGVGYLNHSIRIDVEGNDAPQLSPEYRKGYDHFSDGIAFTQFIGYRHYAKNQMFNFYIGAEFTQAITKNRRGYNFDTRQKDDKTYFDQMYSIKAGFVIVFKKRSSDNFYY